MNETRTFNKKIILASTSPRRQKILEEMGLDFEIIPSGYEENLDNLDFTYEKIENLAYYKAEAVHEQVDTTALILSADTVVVLDDKILGKPKDKQDSFEMLKSLNGKKHAVVTSVCVINPETEQKLIHSTTSFVEFENLSDKTILNYIEEFSPYDKAGSYGIQELPDGFIKCIEGSFYNIIGLCPDAVKEILSEIN